jgi:serine/threonine protein kinase
MGEEWAGSSGTPAFAPPEQLLGEPQGGAADLFAAAALVYFALTGTAPFTGTDSRAILAAQLAGKVDFSSFHPEVADFLRRGLAADPDARFADAAEMQHEWRRVTRDALRDEKHVPFGRRMVNSIERFLGLAPDAERVGS